MDSLVAFLFVVLLSFVLVDGLILLFAHGHWIIATLIIGFFVVGMSDIGNTGFSDFD
jgi:hypothetical protein